jgi:hypothetical protein
MKSKSILVVKKQRVDIKKYELQLIATLCIVMTVIITGCVSPPEGPYQFSPEAELTTHRQRARSDKAYILIGKARIITMEPPGKPLNEIVTLSSVQRILITSIISSDGTVLY